MRKILGVVLVLSMCTTTGWVVSAKEVNVPHSVVEKSSVTEPARKEENHRRVKYEEIKVERAAMKEKWTRLTAAQKNQIYEIQDQINRLKAQKVDKLAEFGVIDRETQAQLKERIKEVSKAMKDSGKLPMGSRQ